MRELSVLTQGDVIAVDGVLVRDDADRSADPLIISTRAPTVAKFQGIFRALSPISGQNGVFLPGGLVRESRPYL